MEEQDIIKKQAKKAAIVIGAATFFGYSVIMLVPGVYMNPFTPYLIVFFLALSPVGIFASFVSGLVAFRIFKKIKNKLPRKLLLTAGSIACIVLGFFLQVTIWRQFAKTKPYMNKIDTNNDGKIDKWVYDDNLNTKVELDIDYDGQPDIREYYNNGTLVKKETRTGSEWK